MKKLTFVITSISIFLSIFLFYVSNKRNNLDTDFIQKTITGINFTSKNDDIKVLENILNATNSQSSDLSLYKQALQYFLLMENFVLPIEKINTEITKIKSPGDYHKIVSSELLEKRLQTLNQNIKDDYFKSRSYIPLENLLFVLLIISQFALAYLEKPNRPNETKT